jgi:hypothetical protein
MARTDALCLAALLDAASRVLPNNNGWNLEVQMPPSSQVLFVHLRPRYMESEIPVSGWAVHATISSRVFDGSLDDPALDHYNVEMLRAINGEFLHQTWPPRYKIREHSSFSKEMLPIVFSALLEHVAPDRGDDETLTRFYGAGGIVNINNKEHLLSVRAARNRNPGIAPFICPEITSALL